MSASKGSMATAKKPAAKPVSKEGAKVVEKKKVVSLKGRVRSGKYAAQSRKRLYINDKKAKADAKVDAKRKSKSTLKLIHRKLIRKTMKNMYNKRVYLARKAGKPLPPPLPVSRVQKRLDLLATRRTKKAAAKLATKNARKEKMEAFMKLYGPNYHAAKKAFNSGHWPKAARDHRRAVIAARAAVPKPKKQNLKPKAKNPWKPPMRRWGSAQKTHWIAAARNRTRSERRSKVKHSRHFGGLLQKIASGGVPPKTAFERMKERRLRATLNTRKQKAASKAEREANPKVRKLSPQQEQRAAKKQKKDEKKKVKRAARNAIRDALKAKIEASGKKYVVRKRVPPRPKGRKASFRLKRKISVFNLDKMRTNHVKWWANGKVTLRDSIKPGTVVIILKGKFAGRRAIFLRQLPRSRDLLVTGPFKVNGVPLYRISQNFVIATSTRLSVRTVPGLKGRLLTDRLFYIRRKKSKKAKTTNKAGYSPEEFFKADKPKKTPYNLHRTKIQQRTDTALMPVIKRINGMKQYLQTTFSLSDKDAPHRMKF